MNNERSSRLRGLALPVAAFFLLSMMLIPSGFAKTPAVPAGAGGQAKQDFELHNATGLEITEVHVSETGNDDWEEDILGQSTLADGDSVKIKFGNQKANMWDMKVVFSNGKEDFWRKLNLAQITDITISFKDGKTWATTKNGD